MNLLRIALPIVALTLGCGGLPPLFGTCAGMCTPVAKLTVVDESGAPAIAVSGSVTIGAQTTTVSCPAYNCADGVIEVSADFERSRTAEVHLESSGKKFDGPVSLSGYRETGEYVCSTPCREASATVTLR